MSTTLTRPVRILLATSIVAAVVSVSTPALGQNETPPVPDTVPTSAVAPDGQTSATSPPESTSTSIPVANDPVGRGSEDPAIGEGLVAEPVPSDAPAVPPRPPSSGGGVTRVARVVRQQLSVARAEAVQTRSSYAAARQRTIELEAQLDQLERAVTTLAGTDRLAVRRVEAARRHFEARAATATIRGRLDDFAQSMSAGSPNEVAIANALLTSVLDADQSALADYIEARAMADEDLVTTADRLVAARADLASARGQMLDARRTNVSAQINLAVFAAGSDIVIHGFVFPVGVPYSFGDSFGAPRMMETEFAHAHQGTDIMAPMGTPLMACERGVVSKMGTDVLGGTKVWLRGESGTFYYYAHLSAFAAGVVDGAIVNAGQVLGYVGDTGNARGGAPHLHFEIHPGGGPAVNPYPLLKVVDKLNREAGTGVFG